MKLNVGDLVYLKHKGTQSIETDGIVSAIPDGEEQRITLNCHWVLWKDRNKPELTHNSRICRLVPINRIHNQ